MDKAADRFWGTLAPALFLFVFSLVWTGGMLMWPRSDEPMAAIFPPWVSPSSAFAAASSANPREIRGFGGWGNVVIVQSNNPAFAERLHRSGALLVVRASKLVTCMD